MFDSTWTLHQWDHQRWVIVDTRHLLDKGWFGSGSTCLQELAFHFFFSIERFFWMGPLSLTGAVAGFPVFAWMAILVFYQVGLGDGPFAYACSRRKAWYIVYVGGCNLEASHAGWRQNGYGNGIPAKGKCCGIARGYRVVLMSITINIVYNCFLEILCALNSMLSYVYTINSCCSINKKQKVNNMHSRCIKDKKVSSSRCTL